MPSLRPAARFVLVLALVASTQGLLLAQASWLVNREWIAETLCVNPDTDCDGMCQLADRMEAMTHGGGHGDEPHGHPATLLELALSVRAQVVERVTVPGPAATDAAARFAEGATDTGREASQGVFHPPRNENAA